MKEQFKRIDDFIEQNGTFDEGEWLLYEVVDWLKTNHVGIEGVAPILELMERHPLVEFGTPGALVHFAEEFWKKGYEPLLEKSIKQTPAVHTIWMLNRLINGLVAEGNEEKAMEYIRIFKSIYADENLHEEIRDAAKNFLEYHDEL